MKITKALIVLIAANFLQGLPVDRELLRVKRKGEGEIDNNEEIFHKVRRSQDDIEAEIRRKRRFFAPDTPLQKTAEIYKTKMEARSSRSSREDRDITAKRPERFRHRIRKRSQDGSVILRGDTSGSGALPGSGSSGAGLWMGPLLEKKRNDKRSAGSNSLDNLIATLRAISSLTPDEDDNSVEEVKSSGSGLWLTPESAGDDKLPQFFREEANSGSGENPEKALRLLSETAQRELKQKTNEIGSGVEQILPNDDRKERKEQNGERLIRRELETDTLADDLIAASENENERGDSEQENELASGSADDWQEIEDKISEQPDEKATRSLTEALLPDAFYRTKRSSQENAFLVSDNSLGKNDALVSDSLVARFYRDQDAPSDDVTETSVTSLPSETKSLSSPADQQKPVKRELDNYNFRDFSEPRVVYTREIREAREPIIERPAVYSQIEDENDMESSFGGEDDDEDDEPTLTIHEREIREDGYVGCYEDKSPDRDLPSIVSVPKLTPDSCRSACRTAGHAYAGVQYGYLCRCGDSYGKYTKVSDEECNTHCTGDHAQKCGGFWRSAIFTTAGAMEPTKRGNFFHIESVQPMTEEDLYDIPRSDIASGGEAEAGEHPQPEIAETSHITASESPSTEATAAEVVTTPLESSGDHVQEIHRESSLQESPMQPLSAETAEEDISITAHASGEGHPYETADSSSSLAPVSKSAGEPNSAHVADISPAPAISEAPPQASTQSEPKVSSDSPTITTQPVPSVVRPQHDETPQGTHGSRLIYLHQQQDILSKPTPKTIMAVAPGKLREGTVAYTGTLKLKQSWLDQFEDANSAESKILTGNIEQAFNRVFKNEPKFVKVDVVGFREGLVKHNPNTIRKVIAPFILTFKNGVQGIEEKLKNMVQNAGRLDDMPVYKHSLQLSEYGHSPAVEKAPETIDKTSKVDLVEEDKKRSAVNIPNGGVDPFLKGIFRQIST
ncbi:uncharacterized protein LOC111345783 isoform X2 [Stylophora pistillata]|uniref:uncharacterized protein LOC111345783 isoform X2 n=1 Tax=Stylophora pistillata TaxID=50429 RepID=UPI000C04460A|nr:uncharacterized protein LOC111345783 isoform X2 [Stylophora pistillata]